ncbi:hypothetical protein BC830DRAFT_1076370 [Chytriomyces sp. MP71]|nr:hypothetical protein BC830DRAFT_1076370 [Chytriomyces sp. MP71]
MFNALHLKSAESKEEFLFEVVEMWNEGTEICDGVAKKKKKKKRTKLDNQSRWAVSAKHSSQANIIPQHLNGPSKVNCQVTGMEEQFIFLFYKFLMSIIFQVHFWETSGFVGDLFGSCGELVPNSLQLLVIASLVNGSNFMLERRDNQAMYSFVNNLIDKFIKANPRLHPLQVKGTGAIKGKLLDLVDLVVMCTWVSATILVCFLAMLVEYVKKSSETGKGDICTILAIFDLLPPACNSRSNSINETAVVLLCERKNMVTKKSIIGVVLPKSRQEHKKLQKIIAKLIHNHKASIGDDRFLIKQKFVKNSNIARQKRQMGGMDIINNVLKRKWVLQDGGPKDKEWQFDDEYGLPALFALRNLYKLILFRSLWLIIYKKYLNM